MSQIGFIGCGNMGGALALAASKAADNTLLLSGYNKEKASALADQINAAVVSNEEIASRCKYIFLGVKPPMLKPLLAGLSDLLKSRTDRFILVSMAAGVAIDSICRMAEGDYPVIRIMPNTPVAIGEGMIPYCSNAEVSEADLAEFLEIMQYAGKLDPIDESLIDAASALSGCGPAFVYLFLEALADGAVKCGLPRAKALQYAVQTVGGAAKMLSETDQHPGELKDAVCSPGGSTIAGIAALESAAFRSATISAVCAAFARTKELGKK